MSLMRVSCYECDCMCICYCSNVSIEYISKLLNLANMISIHIYIYIYVCVCVCVCVCVWLQNKDDLSNLPYK
jgi:hypothetical protein